MQNLRIGFVTPWYGEKIPGGAEMELRQLAHHMADAGISIEILTTCVKSFRDDWNKNYHEPGLTVEAGIPVRRFLVRTRDTGLFDQVNYKLINNIPISEDEERIYCEEMVNSPDLYQYMETYKDEYSIYVFIPYMFGTTFYGVQIAPEKSIIIPCLHDESYAYMNCFRRVFSKVRGMVFLSNPEKKLAAELYGICGERFITLGAGLDTDWKSNAERFRNKYSINDPFILYVGRKEAGKRVDVLIDSFIKYKARHDDSIKLILIGGGEICIPDKNNIIDLGFVDAQDKYDAYAAASVLCNPSEFESFSLVIMESWLAGTPVFVNGKCAVTRDFVQQTNGGLYYESYSEFEKCVEYILTNQSIAAQMGINGQRYVRSNFSWDVIVSRYVNYFEKIACGNH